MSRAVCDLVVRNGYILSMDEHRTVYSRGAVAIDRGAIVAVGPDDEVLGRYEGTRVLDAGGAVVHPGLIDCHVHMMHIARGAFSDRLSLEEGLAFYTNWWNAVEDEDEHASSLLASLELARNGVTCFVEAGTVLEPDSAAAAADAVGLRAVLGDPFLWDCGGLSEAAAIQRAPVSRKRALRLLGGQLWRNKKPDSLIRGHVALYGMGTASDELQLAAKECADEHGTVLAQHQSFEAADALADDKRVGRHPLVHLAEIGVLGSNCVFSHMNFIRDDEVRPVLESGMAIAWCVTSSMMWGVGGTLHGRHAELHRQGVSVGLGSDSANSCGRFDPAQQAFLGVLTAREKRGDRGALGAEDALEMMTISAAKAIGLDSCLGSLVPGKRGDLVIRSNDLPEAKPGLDPVQAIVFSTGSKSVDTVIVDGGIVVRGGRAARVDEQAVYAAAQAASSRMIERLGLRLESRWPVVG